MPPAPAEPAGPTRAVVDATRPHEVAVKVTDGTAALLTLTTTLAEPLAAKIAVGPLG